MLLVITPDGYSRSGWENLGLTRLGLRYWGWAVVGPALTLGITYSIVWSTNLGHPQWSSLQALLTPDGALNFLTNFGVSFMAALAEEIGWRGYLLPNLLSIGRVRAMLLTGFLHGVWHLPLILLSPYYHAEGNRWIVVTLFVLTLTAAGLFYGYLRLASDSVWPVALAHTVFNILWLVLTQMTIPITSTLLLEYLAGESGIITLIGVTGLSSWLVYRWLHQDEKSNSSVLRTEPSTL